MRTKDGKESIPSLSIKAYGEPKIVYRVSKGSFNPIPKVDSAVLQIKNISRSSFKNQYHESLFFKVVKAGFAHKRKVLLSNLKEAFDLTPAQIEIFAIPPKVRAEDLHLTDWLRIAEVLM